MTDSQQQIFNIMTAIILATFIISKLEIGK